MLIIEDGTIVDNATSYVELEEADKYCISRGLWPQTPVTPDQDGLEVPDAEIVQKKERALVRAFDWLNGLEWKGQPVFWMQMTAWPRNNVKIFGTEVPANMVPQVVLIAQNELAALFYGGFDPFAPKERGGLVSAASESSTKSVDVLSQSESCSVTYKDNAPVEAFLPVVAGLLRPWLIRVPGEASSFANLETARG